MSNGTGLLEWPSTMKQIFFVLMSSARAFSQFLSRHNKGMNTIFSIKDVITEHSKSSIRSSSSWIKQLKAYSSIISPIKSRCFESNNLYRTCFHNFRQVWHLLSWYWSARCFCLKQLQLSFSKPRFTEIKNDKACSMETSKRIWTTNYPWKKSALLWLTTLLTAHSNALTNRSVNHSISRRIQTLTVFICVSC